ncbi:unnamed protein product [Prorocentrum cordatum]|uniref:Uncharacterized protein n=1 Tax=Prorocentrum cordatum TaxID=2364126 RepID=A0ABN9RIN4_9DINO|nr:unnamed protein product [Polarella glacialis]
MEMAAELLTEGYELWANRAELDLREILGVEIPAGLKWLGAQPRALKAEFGDGGPEPDAALAGASRLPAYARAAAAGPFWVVSGAVAGCSMAAAYTRVFALHSLDRAALKLGADFDGLGGETGGAAQVVLGHFQSRLRSKQVSLMGGSSMGARLQRDLDCRQRRARRLRGWTGTFPIGDPPGLGTGRRQPATAVGAVEASEKLAPKTTPIAMVIKLLKDLTAKVEAQGKEEAANYDKYSCFCKEQADGKLYAIETSEKKIEDKSAGRPGTHGRPGGAGQRDFDAVPGDDIVALEGEIKTLDEARVEEHEKYQADNAEMVAAIDACERATEALKDSKAAMEGKAELNTKLAQVHAAASSGARKGFVVLTAEQEAALSELSRGPTDGKAYESTYHSNEVIEVLDDLKNQFTKEKNDLDTTEFENKKLYDNIRLEKSNEKKFKEMDKAEKERVEAEKSAEKAAAVEAQYVETRAKTADEEFMGVLKSECEEKAAFWDQRSRTRAEELQALATAIESLESGAAPNWSANKKLNDLQTHKKTPSFLQLRGGRSGRKADGRAKAMALLSSASERLHSSMLAMVSLRVEASQQATQGGRQEDPGPVGSWKPHGPHRTPGG